MYLALSIIQIILTVALLISLGYWYYKTNMTSKQVKHIQTKKRLAKTPVYVAADESEKLPVKTQPKEVARQILSFLDKPDVEAGDMITNVPCLEPSVEGWDAPRQVISVSDIMTYRPQGAVAMKLYELTGQYALWDTGQSKFLMRPTTLSPRDATDLEKQRQAAIDKDDGIVEEYKGYAWDIVGAFGTNTTHKSGEKKCSYLRASSVSGNIKSSLDPALLDGEEHDYYDMQAVNQTEKTPTNTQIMLAFYCHGDWYCYLGRKLEQAELSAMKLEEKK